KRVRGRPIVVGRPHNPQPGKLDRHRDEEMPDSEGLPDLPGAAGDDTTTGRRVLPSGPQAERRPREPVLPRVEPDAELLEPPAQPGPHRPLNPLRDDEMPGRLR